MTDEQPIRPASPWSKASSLAELGELTARWLEGGITHPNGQDTPDDETMPLAGALAAINRAGLVTFFSQPGEPHSAWTQRAAVSGFCSDETCERLAAAFAPTDLLFLAEYHGGASALRIPVTLDNGEPYTWVGGSLDDDYLEICYAGVPATGIAVLSTSWYVTILDPVWGRSDLLWSTLAAALALPSPPQGTDA
jgi:hypothetical protein